MVIEMEYKKPKDLIGKVVKVKYDKPFENKFGYTLGVEVDGQDVGLNLSKLDWEYNSKKFYKGAQVEIYSNEKGYPAFKVVGKDNDKKQMVQSNIKGLNPFKKRIAMNLINQIKEYMNTELVNTGKLKETEIKEIISHIKIELI